MNIKFAGQLFFRKIFGFHNLYLVCGIVRSDKFPENYGRLPNSEHVYAVSGTTVGEGEDRTIDTEGKSPNEILESPFWRVRDN